MKDESASLHTPVRWDPRAVCVFGVAALVLLAGGSTSAGSSSWKSIKRTVAGLPCKAQLDSSDTTDNLATLEQLSWPEGVATGELDIRNDLVVGHVYNSLGGIVTADISDPLRPRMLGMSSTGRTTLDVKINPDGTTAVAGTQVGNTAGLALFDIRNPTKPRLIDEWTSPRPGALQNGHMLYVVRIDGTDWIFLAPNDSTGVWILKLVGPPGEKKVEYVTTTLLVEGGPLGPHDMYVTFDRTLETWVLYAADGYEGWLAYDVGDPTKPQFLGGFLHPSSGYTHTIQAGWVGGRRIVATVEEVGANLLKVYDATDLATPMLLGKWSFSTVPVDAQHNLQIVKDHLYVAHYRRGIYVFDLQPIATAGQPLTSEITPVARYAPQGTSYWDVLLHDGLIYGGRDGGPPDVGSGLDVIGFGCIRPGSPAYSSTG